ncbi:glycosyl hydrolase family 3 [Levilactobacillus brevis]|uniref:glycoside hydrolase family 3 C-terminal domain-containing protein n=1 Tax=Levilactobacillus brevis TaxID=1580 RepID=UPI0005B63988|nr:glycoside hydrolase family 3 C-terminal domain-containing protein [Levilactobacillus brevis]KIR09133.1 glycosyl hydrolase family 3 [Levilactobacillus brevis]
MTAIPSNDFIDQLTLTEKASLVSGKDFWFTAGVERLNLEKIMMTDGPSGLRKQASSADALGLNQSVKAVTFPASALTASSFDRSALTHLGKHLGNAAKAEGVSILLGPGINIKRSPLAGRNFEYFSEDPLVAGELGAAYVTGVQSQAVGVSVKHFAANNRENQRFTSSSNMSERALREIYLAAFERIVTKAHPATIMCSYNAINGTLNSQNFRLLTTILRDEWGFDGVVMSDWGAVADHIAALRAGLDLEMPGKGPQSTAEIVEAVQHGDLAEATLNIAVKRVLKMIHEWHVDSTPHAYDQEKQHQFARRLAANSFILLKNDHQALPLGNLQDVTILGELAEKPRYQGGGSSHVNAFRVTTPLSVAQAAGNTTYQAAYQVNATQSEPNQLAQAVAAAKKAPAVVIFAGVPEALESEGFDKTTMALPENQNTLISQVAAVNNRTVVVLQNGSAIEMPWADDVAAILETYLAGEAVGEATWDVLTGAVNPSGKLAESFPFKLADNPTYGTFNASPLTEDYHEDIFVGYRYYDLKQWAVRYPFGFGLSYTHFNYHDLTVTVQDQQVTLRYQLTNDGPVDGQEISQIYVANHASHIEVPRRELRDFVKTALRSGETKTITRILTRRDFSWYNARTASWQMDDGNYTISVGQSSRQLNLSQDISLTWNPKHLAPITANTYIGDIMARPDLRPALEQTKMATSLDQLANDDTNSELMKNMPLRAAIMVGIDASQLTEFLRLANQIQ